MIRGTCYLAGDDLYYFSTAGHWYRYDDDARALVLASAPRAPKLAPDEVDRLEDELDVEEEHRHQAAVREAVSKIEPPTGPLFQRPGRAPAHLRLAN